MTDDFEEVTLERKLTTAGLAALRPQEKPYYVSDAQQVGLRVRVAPSGALTWNVAFRIKGTGTRSVSLGVCDLVGRSGLSLAEARARAADIVKAARQGRDLIREEQEQRAALRERITVRDLIEAYSKSIAHPNRKGGPLRTAAEIERRLFRALDEDLLTAADDLSRSRLSRLLDRVAETRPREAEKRRQVIGAMFRWGLAKGYVTVDPTQGTQSYGRGEPRERVLSPDEIRSLWDWLDAGAENMPPDCIDVLRLQLCLGARVGEIAGISSAELRVDEGRMIWTLPATRSKNKRERITPLVGRARGLVERAIARRGAGPLFLTALTQRPLTSTDIGHALKIRSLPCAHFSTHDLRRTVVSAMDELGIPLDTIAAVVGHERGSARTRTLVRHYSRPKLDSRVEAALLAWDQRLGGIINANCEKRIASASGEEAT